MQTQMDGNTAGELRPETLDRDDPVPEKWGQVFREQGDFIDELLGDRE